MSTGVQLFFMIAPVESSRFLLSFDFFHASNSAYQYGIFPKTLGHVLSGPAQPGDEYSGSILGKDTMKKIILVFIINRRSFGWTLQLQVTHEPFVQAFVKGVSTRIVDAGVAFSTGLDVLAESVAAVL